MLRTAMFASLAVSACAANVIAGVIDDCLKGFTCGILTGHMSTGKQFGADVFCGAAMDIVGVDYFHSIPGWRAEDRDKAVKAGGVLGDQKQLALYERYWPCANKKKKDYPDLSIHEALAQCGAKLRDFDDWQQRFLAWKEENSKTDFVLEGLWSGACGLGGGDVRRRFGKTVVAFVGNLVAKSESKMAEVWEKIGMRSLAAAARTSAKIFERKVAGEALEALAKRGIIKAGAFAADEGLLTLVKKIGFKALISGLDEVPQNQTQLQAQIEEANEASAQESVSANSTFNSLLFKTLGFGAVTAVGLLAMTVCGKIGRGHVGAPADVEGLPQVHGEGFHLGQQMPMHAGGAQQLHGSAHGHIQPGPYSCVQGAYMPVHCLQGQR